MLNIGKWLGYNYDNKTAVSATSLPTQDEIRTQLRNPIETKPDGYKNSQSSSIRFLPNTNLTAK